MKPLKRYLGQFSSPHHGLNVGVSFLGWWIFESTRSHIYTVDAYHQTPEQNRYKSHHSRTHNWIQWKVHLTQARRPHAFRELVHSWIESKRQKFKEIDFKLYENQARACLFSLSICDSHIQAAMWRRHSTSVPVDWFVWNLVHGNSAQNLKGWTVYYCYLSFVHWNRAEISDTRSGEGSQTAAELVLLDQVLLFFLRSNQFANGRAAVHHFHTTGWSESVERIGGHLSPPNDHLNVGSK